MPTAIKQGYLHYLDKRLDKLYQKWDTPHLFLSRPLLLKEIESLQQEQALFLAYLKQKEEQDAPLTPEEQETLDQLLALNDDEKLQITKELITLLFKDDIERNKEQKWN